MFLTVSTTLRASPDLVWRAVKRPETLRRVARGLLSFDAVGDWPEQWQPGDCVTARLRLFHVLPLWKHRIVIQQVDEGGRAIRSEECGGPVTTWSHVIRVTQRFGGMCHYTDEIEIRAGLLTPLMWLFAHGFYRYRQWRWRSVVASL